MFSCAQVLTNFLHAQASDICSSPSVGWSLTTALSFAFGNDYINEALNRVTYGLVMHIVACAITFLAFIIAACSNRFGYVIAAVFASIAWLATLVTLAIDLAVVLPARSRLTDAGATVEFGIGFWCTIAAAVTLFLGAIAKLFSLCTERSKKRRGGKGQSYAAVVPPVMGHAGYGHGSRDGAALEQQPAYGGKY